MILFTVIYKHNVCKYAMLLILFLHLDESLLISLRREFYYTRGNCGVSPHGQPLPQLATVRVVMLVHIINIQLFSDASVALASPPGFGVYVR